MQFFFSTDKCLLSDNIYDYYNVSQGKVTIPSMDDGEEFTLTDVSRICHIIWPILEFCLLAPRPGSYYDTLSLYMYV